LLGAWRAFPTLAVITGLGILIGVAYTLRAMQRSFYGGMQLSSAVHHAPLDPISIPERAGAVILMLIALAVGLYPTWLLNLIRSGLETPLMAPLLKGGIQ
jgi:NADH-quinone oxidoreductase subunit M